MKTTAGSGSRVFDWTHGERGQIETRPRTNRTQYCHYRKLFLDSLKSIISCHEISVHIKISYRLPIELDAYSSSLSGYGGEWKPMALLLAFQQIFPPL